jgi:hypothetical protein
MTAYIGALSRTASSMLAYRLHPSQDIFEYAVRFFNTRENGFNVLRRSCFWGSGTSVSLVLCDALRMHHAVEDN